MRLKVRISFRTLHVHGYIEFIVRGIVNTHKAIPATVWMLLIGCSFLLTVRSPADEQAQAEESTQKRSSEKISKLVEQLDARYLSDRVKAREQLVKIGKKAVGALMEAARTGSYRIRKGSLLALGKIGDRDALPVLLEAYLSDEPDIKQTSRKAIVQFGVRSFEHLDSYISKHPQTGQKIDELVQQVVRRKVETVFFGEISPDGGVGYYDGQFQELESFGRRVIPVLKNIARGDYDFREHPPTPPPHVERLLRSDYFQQMAINAIGRVGSEEDVGFLKEITAEFPAALDPVSKLATIAMARLGQKGPFNELKQMLSSSYNEALKSNDRFGIRTFGRLYSSFLSRTGQNEKAIEVYKKLLEFREADIMWYNLACSYAQVEKKDKAIEALKKAYKLGYKDAGWLRIDGDMDPLREMDEFQNLLKKMERGEAESFQGEPIFGESDEEENGEDGNDQEDNADEEQKK